MKNGWLLLVLFVIVCSGCRSLATNSPATPSNPISREASRISLSEAEAVTATSEITLPDLLTETIAKPDNSQPSDVLAFVGSQNESKSIATMTSSGQNIHFLTDAAGQDHHPTWSPNGKYVAFLSNRALLMESDHRDLWLIDVTEQKLIQLTFEGKLHKFSSFVWGPKSERIAYSQAQGPVNIIYLANKVSEPLGDHLHAPLAWSPNGQWIAVEEAVQISQESNVPGRFLTIVSPGENTAIHSNYPLSTVTSFAWSSDNQHLAIGTSFSSRGDGDLSLITISQDGNISTEVRLSDSFDSVNIMSPEN